MFRNGILVLTSAVLHQKVSLPLVIQSSAQAVRNLLYVHLVNSGEATGLSQLGIPCTQVLRRYITDFYTEAARIRLPLEVRFLVGNLSESLLQTSEPHSLEHGYDVVLTDLKPLFHHDLTKYLQTLFPVNLPIVIKQVEGTVDDASELPSESDMPSESDRLSERVKTYRSVCLGGTFDRLHVGHRILLTEACLLANESLTVGVTRGSMTSKKILNELMHSVEERIKGVQQFVHDIKPGLHFSIVPIDDLYGPAGTDASIECIVVSRETVRGAAAVNIRRAEQGMNQLAVETIELVTDEQHSADEEDKVSSSSLRKRLLGTLIRSPLKESCKPYIIGLTGGTASGKSSICTRLKGEGAGIIECDKLGHLSYEPGTQAYQQIIEQFGQEVLDSDGRIDRRSLGSRVFTNKGDLEKLNAIVWPAIRQLCMKEIDCLSANGKSIIVLDAAVLLEAGWDDMVNEIWTTVIPLDEAVKRLVDRNGLSAEEALRRIESQMTNEQRVARANVVLCTLWHPDVTQKQVVTAWQLLQQRLAGHNGSKTD